MKRVPGIGGIFFKTKNPELNRKWYSKHLGLTPDEYGSAFEWNIPGSNVAKGLHNGPHSKKPPNILRHLA